MHDRDTSEERWGDLLAAAQRGDGVAYRRFLIVVTPFLRALARRRIHADEAVEDVVQETLLTVHRIRQTYEPGRPVEPWLAAIVARRSIDALRKSSRTGAREVHNPLAYETFAEPAANTIEAGESAKELARMMDGLPPRQKEALELTKLKELSLNEASAVSGQSVASLKVNVHRAIKRIRLQIGKDFL
ncbi:MAG: sigma-70 family RNA polymerase sigma factor [Sphingomonas bacterium]|nr:sigma-70 family RNA polymerase sigma factor [Sphingomonas bacterium]